MSIDAHNLQDRQKQSELGVYQCGYHQSVNKEPLVIPPVHLTISKRHCDWFMVSFLISHFRLNIARLMLSIRLKEK